MNKTQKLELEKLVAEAESEKQQQKAENKDGIIRLSLSDVEDVAGKNYCFFFGWHTPNTEHGA